MNKHIDYFFSLIKFDPYLHWIFALIGPILFVIVVWPDSYSIYLGVLAFILLSLWGIIRNMNFPKYEITKKKREV